MEWFCGVRGDGKIVALLATARIANVPSVLSNLLAGVLLGGMFLDWNVVWPWWLGLAGVLFYVSGNFLNDWADRKWDVVNRPERALPRGLFSSGIYLGVGIMGLLVGLFVCGFYGWLAVCVGLVLCGLIVLYTWVHKRVAWGVVPMGMCRGCLPVLGFVAVRKELDWVVLLPAMALFLYVMGLSMSARGEARGERSVIGGGLIWVTCAVGMILPMITGPSRGWVGTVPFGFWVIMCMGRYRSPVGVHVSALLAGIPLVDGLLLLPLAVMMWGSAVGWFAMGMVMGCFLLGRILQRVAPAT